LRREADAANHDERLDLALEVAGCPKDFHLRTAERLLPIEQKLGLAWIIHDFAGGKRKGAF
jgi:hypothetical protein